MITCKEDLINTYIENDHGECLDAYIALMKKFSIRSCADSDFEYLRQESKVFVSCSSQFNKHGQSEWCENDIGWSRMGYKKLTLPDLKPRTKVEYVYIDFKSTSDAYRYMLDGLSLYSQDGESEFKFDGKNFVGIDSDGGVYALECHSDKDPFFRKVERPIEWWEDLEDFISKSKHASEGNYSLKKGEEFFINACMTRDQWCDFARILLEQNDE